MDVAAGIKSIFFGTIICITALPVAAQDDAAARQVALDRYLEVVPISGMLNDAFTELSKQLPPEQRAEFIARMQSIIHADRLELIVRESMLRIFTADELNALADFYGSEHGSSAMRKFGAYLADVTPAVQAEIQRAIQQLSTEQPK